MHDGWKPTYNDIVQLIHDYFASLLKELLLRDRLLSRVGDKAHRSLVWVHAEHDPDVLVLTGRPAQRVALRVPDALRPFGVLPDQRDSGSWLASSVEVNVGLDGLSHGDNTRHAKSGQKNDLMT
jgi:hypothetical protein